MTKRYLGKTGEDETIIEFKFGDFGKAGNEYFEEFGLILTYGSIPVSVPFQVGKIENIRLQNDSVTGPYEYSVRVWFFNKPITSQVRAEIQDLTSSDMDGLIGFTEFRCLDYISTPQDAWINGGIGGSVTSHIQKTVNMPYVLDENMKIYVIGEYIGIGRTFFDQTTTGYLHLKRD